jgi:hypothetical protein
MKNEKVAILVVHGIGQEKPYETLDHFTRKLMESLGTSGTWTITPELEQVSDPTRISKSWTRASFLIKPSLPDALPLSSEPDAAIESISLFEYYWAPITQDKVTYTGSLLFLIKAGLQPFLYLASNVTAIARTEEAAAMARGKSWSEAKTIGKAIARKRIPFIIAKELWRQASLFLPLLGFFIALLYWLKEATFQNLSKLVHFKWSTVVLISLLSIRYLYLYSAARALWQSWKVNSGWQTSISWRVFLVIVIVAHLLLLPFLLAPALRFGICLRVAFGHCFPFVQSHFPHWASVNDFAKGVSFPPPGKDWRGWISAFIFLDPTFGKYTAQMLTLLLAAFVRFILVDYVGDVAVYANSSQFSKSYSVRSQIIDECTAALSAILMNTAPRYDRVLIVAHSLGSVIAYDTMNNLMDLASASSPAAPNAIQPKHLETLKGFITFGCPLNKIFYFFRVQDDASQVLRHQTLDLLYSFRGVVLTAAPRQFQFQPPAADSQRAQALSALKVGFKWINAYSLADPISGRIVFYQLDDQRLFQYAPLIAHLSYWEDPNFYSYFRQYLL